jgi:hypothetical protein
LPISFAVPLSDFTDAYDGPAQETKVIELSPQEMQAELAADATKGTGKPYAIGAEPVLAMRADFCLWP